MTDERKYERNQRRAKRKTITRQAAHVPQPQAGHRRRSRYWRRRQQRAAGKDLRKMSAALEKQAARNMGDTLDTRTAALLAASKPGAKP